MDRNKLEEIIKIAEHLCRECKEVGIEDPFLRNSIHEAIIASKLGLEWNPAAHGPDAFKDGKGYEIKSFTKSSKGSLTFRFNCMSETKLSSLLEEIEGVYFVIRDGFDIHDYTYLPMKGSLHSEIERMFRNSKAKTNNGPSFPWKMIKEIERTYHETGMGY